MADAYRVLNLSFNASLSEIRSAYLELACQHHPCKLSDRQAIDTNYINSNANHTQFRLAAEAYALIGDDARRELYDLINSADFRKSAGRYAQDVHEGDSLGQERLGLPTGRSRARSELTIDLRVGLPPELKALLTDLDPVKVFNQVVCQIDQERRAQQQQQAQRVTDTIGNATNLKASNNTSSMAVPQSKYLSPHSCFLDESSFSRAGTASKSSGGSIREDGKQQPLSALKTGILRDESKSQFRKSPSSISELLSRDHGEPYQSSVQSDYYEPIRSSAHSTSSSSYISNSASVSGGSSHKNNRSRRVSFSNDVIESDEIKLAREAVKSFKSEAARMAPKPTLINPTSPRHSVSSSIEINKNNHLRGLVNKFGSLTTQGISTSPTSTFKKPNEFFLDKSLYSDLCSPIDSIPQDILIKPIGIGAGRDSHLPTASGLSCSPLMSRKIHGAYRDREVPNEYNNFLASSAPTGFLSRYRADQDLLHQDASIPKSHHHQHLHQSPYLSGQVDRAFPWSDPNFDNPRSIHIGHRNRDVN
ncbi:hypothetical protein PSHT_04676 [Puccinia striiformis]|uniref:J domain-containing protein n=1 Tax=Puccinia striiformis TaxID=27350 RepID=A0A2S4WCC2_9BASI|nr:hypothetical protein PSHT_04676 [Puccinia striiformis]